MPLDITGKLIKVLAPQSGTSSKGNWLKQEFVIETNEQYPKKAVFSLWGDKADLLKNYKQGEEMKVYFNVESREYNERWYTELRAWKIEPAMGKGSSSSSISDQDLPQSFDLSGEEEDLPF